MCLISNFTLLVAKLKIDPVMFRGRKGAILDVIKLRVMYTEENSAATPVRTTAAKRICTWP